MLNVKCKATTAVISTEPRGEWRNLFHVPITRASHIMVKRSLVASRLLVMTIVLLAVFFIPTPTLAACNCVCTGCNVADATVQNQNACDLYCANAGANIQGGCVGVCSEPGTSSVPVVPDTGAAAVRGRLEGIAERGVGFPEISAAALAGRIVRAALVLLGVIFLTLTIYGGSLYLTAGGNEEQVKKAKAVLIRAAIGLIIVLFAGAITQFITGYLGRAVVVH